MSRLELLGPLKSLLVVVLLCLLVDVKDNKLICCVEGLLRWVGKKLSPIIASPASSTLTLRCLAAGDPSPNITWLKDGEPLVERYMGSVSSLPIVCPITLHCTRVA